MAVPNFYYLLADGQLLLYVADAVSLSMSPVSPVFNTEVTVSIGLKTNFRMGTNFIKFYIKVSLHAFH